MLERNLSCGAELEEDREQTDEVGHRIDNWVLVIRQHTPTDDPIRALLCKYKTLDRLVSPFDLF